MHLGIYLLHFYAHVEFHTRLNLTIKLYPFYSIFWKENFYSFTVYLLLSKVHFSDLFEGQHYLKKIYTVFPHIVSAETIFNAKFSLRKLFKGKN